MRTLLVLATLATLGSAACADDLPAPALAGPADQVIEYAVEQGPPQRRFEGDWSGTDRTPPTFADFGFTGYGYVPALYQGGAAFQPVGWPYYGPGYYRPWYSYYGPYGGGYRGFYRPWYSYRFYNPYADYNLQTNPGIAPQYGLEALYNDIGVYSSGAWAAQQQMTAYYGPYGPWYAGQVAWPGGVPAYQPFAPGMAYGGCFYW